MKVLLKLSSNDLLSIADLQLPTTNVANRDKSKFIAKLPNYKLYRQNIFFSILEAGK